MGPRRVKIQDRHEEVPHETQEGQDLTVQDRGVPAQEITDPADGRKKAVNQGLNARFGSRGRGSVEKGIKPDDPLNEVVAHLL